jgi:septal ring factor EnvC (AmiA/AmiB activator)
MKTRLRLAAVLLFAPAALGAGPGVAEAPRKSLEKIHGEIDQKRREKEAAALRARELRAEVERISQELEGARQSLASTESRLGAAEKKREAAETRLGASRESLDRWEERLAVALTRFYTDWIIAAEGSFQPLIYQEALLSERVTGLSFAQENHQGVQALRDDLAEAENALRGLKRDKEREEQRIEKARAQLRGLQRTAEGRQAVLDRQIRDLNASAKKFEKMVQELIAKEREAQARAAREKKVSPAAGPSREAEARWRGKLPWPVTGSVVEKFGRIRHPELDTYVISNGVKVRPGAGAAVRAVDGGEALFAGPFMNYGLMALVSHPGGAHTIYAHLGELNAARGQKLAAGDVVGTPGRDEQGRPVVYFELRIEGQPVDPEQWLR